MEVIFLSVRVLLSENARKKRIEKIFDTISQTDVRTIEHPFDIAVGHPGDICKTLRVLSSKLLTPLGWTSFPSLINTEIPSNVVSDAFNLLLTAVSVHSARGYFQHANDENVSADISN